MLKITNIYNLKGDFPNQSTLLKYVREHGTPLFVIIANRIERNYKKLTSIFRSYFGKFDIFFSYKSIYLKEVYRLLHKMGAGAEVMTKEELEIALDLVTPDRIIYNSPYKKDDELELGIRKNIKSINIDSIDELVRIDRIANRLKYTANVGIRIRVERKPDQIDYKDSKLGISFDKIPRIIELLKKTKNIKFKGLHFHIGTQVTNPKYYVMAIEHTTQIMKLLHRNKINIEFLDIGGGFSSFPLLTNRYSIHTIESVAKKIGWAINSNTNWPKEETIIIEPGRFLISDSVLCLSRVGYIKDNWVLIDAGVDMLPSLYSARYEIAAFKHKNRAPKNYNIGGPLCMENDFIAKNMKLPEIKVGEVIVILNCGAYTQSFLTRNVKRNRILFTNGNIIKLTERF